VSRGVSSHHCVQGTPHSWIVLLVRSEVKTASRFPHSTKPEGVDHDVAGVTLDQDGSPLLGLTVLVSSDISGEQHRPSPILKKASCCSPGTCAPSIEPVQKSCIRQTASPILLYGRAHRRP